MCQSVEFEVLEGEAFDALAGEIYGRQLRSEAEPGEDVLDLHFMARSDNECNLKAIDEVFVTPQEEKTLLKDFKPDSLPAEYGLDQRRLHDHLLYLFDNDIDHYEMAIHDWDHTHEVLRQDYDLDYTTGWDGDFNEHTYVPPDTLVADMRHGEGPDGGGGRDND